MNEAKEKKMPIFAARFSELRGERTQAEFAEFLGISRPTVGFYENGDRIPDALVLKQIAERCDVTTDYLVGLSDNKTYSNAEIGEATGLSDNAIETLSWVVGQRNDYRKEPNEKDRENLYASALMLINCLLDTRSSFFALSRTFFRYRISKIESSGVPVVTAHDYINDLIYEVENPSARVVPKGEYSEFILYRLVNIFEKIITSKVPEYADIDINER